MSELGKCACGGKHTCDHECLVDMARTVAALKKRIEKLEAEHTDDVDTSRERVDEKRYTPTGSAPMTPFTPADNDSTTNCGREIGTVMLYPEGWDVWHTLKEGE